MKRALASACLLGLAPAAASAQVAPAGNGNGGEPATAFRDTRDEVERNQLLGKTVNPRDARIANERYGQCAAKRESSEARRLLTMDFTSSRYRSGLKALSRDAERNCAQMIGTLGSMRSDELLFAGAIAEALLEADTVPLNNRLARRVAAQVPTYGATDAIAQCLAKSLPDQVGTLFGSEPGSSSETSAAEPLLAAVPACARAAGILQQVEVSVPALRAIVATAAYRLIASSGDAHAQG